MHRLGDVLKELHRMMREQNIDPTCWHKVTIICKETPEGHQLCDEIQIKRMPDELILAVFPPPTNIAPLKE